MRKIKRFSCLLAACTLFLGCGNGKRTTAEASALPAKAACVTELNSRRILYEHNGEAKLPMASTTKILTAISVIESEKNLDEAFEIPAAAEGVEGSSVYLKAGERYSARELLYGLMLRSGNDCAVALALYTSGSLAEFSSLMNATAERAGALSSHFANPHGLPQKEHYTTARDLSFIACYALQRAQFREIVSTQYYRQRNWENKNKMLYAYEGAFGVKTGYTREAGRCLVSAAEREGMSLVCTVLNCSDTYGYSAKLLDDSFSAYKYVRLLGAETPVRVEAGRVTVNGCVGETLCYPLLTEERAYLKTVIQPCADAHKKKKGEIIGQIKIFLINRLLFSRNLYKL